ncbi:MAG: lipopolysaccharide biosynthesis protein [Staphylococcus equorum]|nr:lipopolysaccharide biosynthesis protein [Atopostipes sp.]MDN6571526.1 lipopolysaccharide biosynthesis protein [Staphylococcus equorum]
MEDQLKKKALGGFIWTILESMGSRFIQLVVQVILARLLLPEDFGIVGMITIFIAISQSLLDSGFQNALIREKNVGNKEYSTVFFFNLFMSLILYGVLFFIAPFVATFYNTPILTEVLRVLGLIIIVNSFGLIQRTMLSKRLNFKRQTKIILISSMLAGLVSIILAWQGFGVWSLVLQQLLNQFFQAMLLMVMNKWKPLLIFDLPTFKRYFRFGWKLTASGIINTLYQNSFYVIIGRFYSSTQLGYYTNSQKFNDVPVQAMTQAIRKVTYPLLSELNDNEGILKTNYRIIIRYSAAASFLMMMMLSASANNLIPFIFGENWLPSVPYFQILCIAGMFYPINAINLNILQVMGRSDLFLSLEVVKKVVGIFFIALSIILDTGIIGLVWANVIATLFNTSLNIIISARLINYSYFEQLGDLYKFLLNSILMVLTMIGVDKIVSMPVILTLFSQYILGFFVYIIVGKFVFKLPEINQAIRFVMILLRKFKRIK